MTKAKTTHTCQGVSEKTGKNCGRSVPEAGSFCTVHAHQNSLLATVKHGTHQQRLLVAGMTSKQLLDHLKTAHTDWRVDPKAKVFVRNQGAKSATERSPGYKIKSDDEVQFHRPAGRLGC